MHRIVGGGDARYGNEEFLKNVEAWAASVRDFPEHVLHREFDQVLWTDYHCYVRFIDFGSLPCFVALSELASTEERREELQRGYAQYLQLYAKDLELPGPYLKTRSTNDFDRSLDVKFYVGNTAAGNVDFLFPTSEFIVLYPRLSSP